MDASKKEENHGSNRIRQEHIDNFIKKVYDRNRREHQEELLRDVVFSIEKAMRLKSVTKEELAAQAKISKGYLTRLFSLNVNPRLETLAKIGAVLDVRIDFELNPIDQKLYSLEQEIRSLVLRAVPEGIEKLLGLSIEAYIEFMTISPNRNVLLPKQYVERRNLLVASLDNLVSSLIEEAIVRKIKEYSLQKAST